jgi:hypothetical protein
LITLKSNQAITRDHEHDLADFEVFLWKLGRPWEEALRITYNPANDRWPDMFVEK